MTFSDSETESRATAVGRKRKAVNSATEDLRYDDAIPAAEYSESEDGEIRTDSSPDGLARSRPGSPHYGRDSKRPRRENSTMRDTRSMSRESGEVSSSDSVDFGVVLPRERLGRTSNAASIVTRSDNEEAGSVSESGEYKSDPDDHSENEHRDSSDTNSSSESSEAESELESSVGSISDVPSDNQSKERDRPERAMPENYTRLDEVSDEEQIMLWRYFRLRRPDDIIYCLCCGALGHSRTICPERKCPHCQAVEKHAPGGCPLVRKCSRCRQPGHDVAECANRTFRGTLSCDVCFESDHIEDECPRLWCVRPKPDYDNVHRIADGKMYRVCYNCGKSGYRSHWGDDCPRKKAFPADSYSQWTRNAVTTWSTQHADMFIKTPEHLPISEPVTETPSITDWQHAMLDGLLDDDRD